METTGRQPVKQEKHFCTWKMSNNNVEVWSEAKKKQPLPNLLADILAEDSLQLVFFPGFAGCCLLGLCL